MILANGDFPKHAIPLNILGESGTMICCDGAVDKLCNSDITPKFIIGDMDSISKDSKTIYGNLLISDTNQSKNDLSKALEWCVNQKIDSVTILGASGGRDDHHIGNFFRLFEFSELLKIQMISDFGIFTLITEDTIFSSFPNQQISIFLTDLSIRLTTDGLKYPLKNECLNSLYFGTLNESNSDTFKINLSHGSTMIFQEHQN